MRSRPAVAPRTRSMLCGRHDDQRRSPTSYLPRRRARCAGLRPEPEVVGVGVAALPFTSSQGRARRPPFSLARASRTMSSAPGVTRISPRPRRNATLAAMAPEPQAPADAHEWVSFEDPSEERTWLIDVTFLSSSWQCIYGCGCQGVLTAPAPEQMEGCCSYGAHFTDEADARTRRGGRRDAHRGAVAVPLQGSARKAGVLKARREGDHHDAARRRRLHLLEPPGSPRRRRLRPAPGRARTGRAAPRAQARRVLAAPAPARGHRRGRTGT